MRFDSWWGMETVAGAKEAGAREAGARKAGVRIAPTVLRRRGATGGLRELVGCASMLIGPN